MSCVHGMTRRSALMSCAGLLGGSRAMAASEFRLRDDVASAVVVLRIFSGRPDPKWTLTGPDLAELIARLKALAPSGAAQAATLPPLGYQGMTIMFPDGAMLDVGAGQVRLGARTLYDDRDRAFERWLLDSGSRRIDAAPLDAARAEIERAR